MNRNMKSTRRFQLQYDEIGISEFVSNYIGIDANCTNLYHRGLKSLESPYVIGVSNETADKFPDYVATGKILKVRDARGHLGTYINPQLIVDYANNVENREKSEKVLKKIRVNELNNLQNLYEKALELNNIIKQINESVELIRDISKTDEEEHAKIKQFKTSASKISKMNKIIDF